MDSGFINPKDFISLKLKFVLKNTTTQTECKKKDLIGLVEILDKGFTLEVPARTCSTGHKVFLEIHGSQGDEEAFSFSCTANVESLENHGDRDKITLEMLQFDEAEWENLLKGYGSMQTEIENFFHAVKGY